MRKRIKPAILCLAITANLLFAPAYADCIGGGVVKTNDGDGVNLRSGPSTSYDSLMLVPDGSAMVLEGKEGDWYKVFYGGSEGYVRGDYVASGDSIESGLSGTVYVSGDDVNMRGGPSTGHAVLGQFDTGEAMSLVGVSGKWLKVSAKSGTVGYIRSDYVSFSQVAAAKSNSTAVSSETASAAAATNVSARSDVVETAKQFLGTGYVWGGMSPSGFDCSGFVGYVYKLHGYTLQRVAQDIYSKNGTSVEKSELQPGDLVFFGYSTSSISHVGMYIGDNKIIHASSSSAKVVISEMEGSYFEGMLVGAKRIL